MDIDFNEIKSIINVNENLCVETNPCRHEILFELKNNNKVNTHMSSNEIVKYCIKFNYKLNYPEHFN